MPKYRSTRDVIDDLRANGRLIDVHDEVDPFLELAEIHRRVYASGGPALLFHRVRGTSFPVASNLFASLDQAQFLFRDTLESVRRLIEAKVDPSALPKRPWRYAGVPLTALRMLPKGVRSGPILKHQTTLSALPQIQCWPDDGGAFVTLPQVLSADPAGLDSLMRVNLGMIACKSAETITSPIAKSAFIIRSIAAWVCITGRQWIATKSCEYA